jgi:hypothetical protein
MSCGEIGGSSDGPQNFSECTDQTTSGVGRSDFQSRKPMRIKTKSKAVFVDVDIFLFQNRAQTAPNGFFMATDKSSSIDRL